MSSKKQIFYILAHKSFGVKMIKSLPTVKKYESLYPTDLVIEKYSDEKDAEIRLDNLNSQYLNYKLSHDLIAKEILDEKMKFSLKTNHLETNSENFYSSPFKSEDGEISKSIQDQIYKHFRENDHSFQKAKIIIDAKENYHLFFDSYTHLQSRKTGCGYIIYDRNLKSVYYNSIFMGIKSVQNPFISLLYGLKSSINLGIKNVCCYNDKPYLFSVLQRKVISYQTYYNELLQVNSNFSSLKFHKISLSQNETAHSLAKNVISKKSLFQ